MIRTAITGMAFHVPDKIVTNADLENMMNILITQLLIALFVNQ